MRVFVTGASGWIGSAVIPERPCHSPRAGVRSSSVRFAPTVHGRGDYGFVAVLVGIAREKGFSGYIDDGSNRWPAVHRLDAANLVRLAVDQAPAGAALHATAEEGVPTRAIADVIGRGLNLPVVSVPADQASDHFGWMARFFGVDAQVSSTVTANGTGGIPQDPGSSLTSTPATTSRGDRFKG